MDTTPAVAAMALRAACSEMQVADYGQTHTFGVTMDLYGEPARSLRRRTVRHHERYSYPDFQRGDSLSSPTRRRPTSYCPLGRLRALDVTILALDKIRDRGKRGGGRPGVP